MGTPTEQEPTIAGRRAALEDRPLSQTPFGRRQAERYRGYAELLSALGALLERGARAESIGQTARGEPIFALEVGPPEADRLSLVIAGLHAMEWIGVEVGLTLFTRLVATPPRDRRVLYVPVVNVDGFRRVEASLREGRRRYLRANANGVDLNRNWPTHFRSRHLPGLLMPWLGGAGARPRSEPEVDAVCARLEREGVETRLDRALSLHSFGRMILTPWGGRLSRPAAAGQLDAQARAVRRRIEGRRYRAVQVSRWWPGFFAHGLEIDHLHSRHDALALLVECSLGGLRLADPSSWTVPFRWYNPPDPTGECAGLAPALDAFLRGALP